MEAATSTSTTLLSVKNLSAFPAAELESTLRDELITAITAEANFDGVEISGTASEIAEIPFEIDSLTVVEMLCALDPLVGFELKSTIVQTGGYRSIKDATDTLLPRIHKQWGKHHGVETCPN